MLYVDASWNPNDPNTWWLLVIPIVAILGGVLFIWVGHKDDDKDEIGWD